MKKSVNQDTDRDWREIEDLGEHILLFKNFFSRDFCEDCIDTFEDVDRAGLTVKRQNSSFNMDDKAISHCALPPSSLPLVNPLQHIIKEEIIPEFCKKYPIESQYNEIHLGGAKMQKTEPQQGYHVWHMEHSSGMDSYRSVCAWALFLNDVEEGGELEFLYQSKRIQPRQGEFVLWPAGYTHQHRGNPPLKGVKYIYTGWLDTL